MGYIGIVCKNNIQTKLKSYQAVTTTVYLTEIWRGSLSVAQFVSFSDGIIIASQN